MNQFLTVFSVHYRFSVFSEINDDDDDDNQTNIEYDYHFLTRTCLLGG